MPISKGKWEPVNAEYYIKLYNASTVESSTYLRSLRLLNLNFGKAHFSVGMQRHLYVNSMPYSISVFRPSDGVNLKNTIACPIIKPKHP